MSKPVCVLGLGLIGGSVLRAAVASGRTAWGYNRSIGAVEAARSDGYDAGADLVTAVQLAATHDALIVVAVPMPAVDAVLKVVAEHAPHCALTDVVSVKAEVAAVVAARGLTANYVGGHPMAGTSTSGWVASEVDLFRNAVWVISVDDDVDPDVWTAVAELALTCGSVVVPAVSGEHDRAVARVSHLPHLLAETLATVGAGGGDLSLRLAAGSFRDGTRVAGTAPALVDAMCEANAAALTIALDDAIALLVAARDALDTDASTSALVQRGHDARVRYENQLQWFEITDFVVGRGDWLDVLREAGRKGGVIQSLPS